MNDHHGGVRFGVFLGPNAGALDQLRANVAAAEVSGFDYVTIQDHPYSDA